MLKDAEKTVRNKYETDFRQGIKENLEFVMDKFDLSTRIVAPFFGVSHKTVHMWRGAKFCIPLVAIFN